MEIAIMLSILDKLECLIIKNRTYEAKRLIHQELDNLRGITEKDCKLIKLREDYCRVCTNLNCNYNQNRKRTLSIWKD